MVRFISSSGWSRRSAGEQVARDANLRALNCSLDWDPDTSRLVELVKRLVHGHEDAFRELYDKTSSRVLGTKLRVLRSPHLAEEVTQEVYVEIWRKASQYDPERGSVLAWMGTMAHRRAVDRVRATTSEMVRDEQYAALSADGDFDQVWDEVESRIDTARVRKALDTLTDIQREAITLAYFDGYSQSQVARLLNLPLGTVKARIRDGLIALRDALRMWT
jgi:RNA polymerase sigma-70 factor (ECF subfamily)